MTLCFSARSVQSIIGATQNRCDNILMLFRFFISSGVADFFADRSFKLTVEAFSFHFKCFFGRLLSLLEYSTLLGTALQCRTSSRSTVLAWEPIGRPRAILVNDLLGRVEVESV